MVDDQSRPSENEHQDAESEADEARSASDGRAATPRDDPASEDAEREAPDDDEALDAEEISGAAETPDADAALGANDPEVDGTEGDDFEGDDSGVDNSETDNPVGDDSETGDSETSDFDDESVSAGDSGADVRPAPPETAAEDGEESSDSSAQQTVPDDVRKYERFKKMDGAQYDRVNEFLRERTYITAREWAIARLCADFRTETGVEMTKIGENLPELVPFMTDTYTPQAVNQARSSFEGKVRQAGATFLYGAMSGFFTAEELDDMMYEVTEVAKFLLEVEGVDLSVDEELEAEDRISGVMREVQSASEQLRHDEMECPNCGHEMEEADAGSDD